VRTTLTLDDDVAALLERVRKKRNLGHKEAVNEAMRRGLAELARGDVARPERVRIEPVDVGPSLVGSIDDAEEVLAVAEGEDHA
jgi:hypothetical protein